MVDFIDDDIDNVRVKIYKDYKNGDFKSNTEYFCDAMRFYSGGYYGLQNPKYDSDIKNI